VARIEAPARFRRAHTSFLRATPMPDASAPLTVRDLRRRWKPHKESLLAAADHHPTAVRLHRAFSWLARVEGIGADGSDNDVVLVCQWIALNALYGRWDPEKCEPSFAKACQLGPRSGS
jgi:hypothetical protein